LFALWAAPAGLARLNRTALAGALAAVAVAAAVVAPGLPSYYAIQAVVGERELADQEGAALADYARPQPNSLLGRALGLTGQRWEHTLFPGLAALALAAVGLAHGARRSADPAGGGAAYHWQGFYLLLALAGLVLSFGPTLHATADGPPLVRGMPYAWLYQAIPPLAALRVPARLAVLMMLGLAMLAGRGVAALAERWRGGPGTAGTRAGWAALAGLVALAVEYVAVPVPHRGIETGDSVPPVYRWLAGQAFDGAIFELPTARTSNITDDQLSIQRMARQQYFSVYHWHPIVIGYSGTNAPTFRDVIDYAPAAASPAGLEFLRGLGVSRIVAHRDQMTWDEWATFAEAAARRPGLRLEAEVGQSAVYAIGPAANGAAPAWQAAGIAFGPHLTLAEVQRPEADTVVAGEALVVSLRWHGDGAQARALAVSLQVLNEAGEKANQADYFFPEGGGWPPGEALTQRTVLALPRDLVPGRYRLQAIVYQQADLAAVGEPATLAHLRVVQPPEFLIQYPFPARLGAEIELLGFDAELAARPGGAMPVALYWRRLSPILESYTVFVHLRRPDGTVLAQQDNPPRAGAHPTTDWRAGETVIDRFSLDIPADAAGEYDLAIGMYLPPGTEPLPAYDAQGQPWPEGSIILTTVQVRP
jgi:hypothetical protein